MHSLTSLLCGTTLLSLLAPVTLPALAAEPVPTRASQFLIAQGVFTPPGDGEPDDTASGASRPPANQLCPGDLESSTPLTLLRPQTGDNQTRLLNYTATARPTLIAYVPPTSASALQLRLHNPDLSYEQDALVELPDLSETGGIVQIPLPASFPDLTTGETYTWFVTLTCASGVDPNAVPLRDNFAYRPAAPPAALNETETSLALVAWYGENGIWLDTLALAADLKQAQPQDAEVSANWRSLLETAGLDPDTFADLPIVEANELETANR